MALGVGTPTEESARSSWSAVEHVGDEFVLVTVRGGIAADRSVELWSALEEALETAVGRLVIADLRDVTGFDVCSISALARVAKASSRRRLDICVLLHPSSALEYYLRCCDLLRLLPAYASLFAALDGVEAPIGPGSGSSPTPLLPWRCWDTPVAERE
jgi:anti-anti-sigma factor